MYRSGSGLQYFGPKASAPACVPRLQVIESDFELASMPHLNGACEETNNIGYPEEEGDKSIILDLNCEVRLIAGVELNNKLAAGIERWVIIVVFLCHKHLFYLKKSFRGTADFTIHVSYDMITWTPALEETLADNRLTSGTLNQFDVMKCGRYVKFTQKTYYG